MASILVGPDPPAMLQVHLALGGPPIDHRLCHMHATVTNDASTELHGAGVDCRVNTYIPIILFEHMASILVGPDPPAMLQVHLAMGGPFIDHRLCHMHALVTNDGSFFLSTWHRF